MSNVLAGVVKGQSEVGLANPKLVDLSLHLRQPRIIHLPRGGAHEHRHLALMCEEKADDGQNDNQSKADP